MILVFGGTTEGRKAVATLEQAGNTFYYSTKTGEQDITLHHGIKVDGAMDSQKMMRFCKQQGIRLIVDAAHPFAQELHRTVEEVSKLTDTPVVRFERIFPPRHPKAVWIASYDELPHIKGTLLATTGVQSIAHLKKFESPSLNIIYRILNRESSIRLAHRQGADEQHLCFYNEEEDEKETLRRIQPDAILMKESGLSGGYMRKLEAATELGIKPIILKRPETPPSFHCVNGEHGLRRMVERLLPEFFPLHSGLTTGTCATAAAVAQAMRMLEGKEPESVPVMLPDGETIMVDVKYADTYAYVKKESGDDPDVTNGIEVRASIEPSEKFEICGGTGVGTITLPGFDAPPGSPAINRGPRMMLEQNLKRFSTPMRVTISVPEGEEIAKRTFNPRLGITGGISIIGVSGIIQPYSEEAFVESIRKCMVVAQQSGTERVVINSGAKSENYLRKSYPQLPRQAFVEYGNYIGETIKIAGELGIKKLTLGIMMGKAVKLAAGNLDTHSRKTTFDIQFILSMLEEAGCGGEIMEQARHITLARELWDIIPNPILQSFCEVVIRHCMEHCAPLMPQGEITILMIDDKGNIYSKESSFVC